MALKDRLVYQVTRTHVRLCVCVCECVRHWALSDQGQDHRVKFFSLFTTIPTVKSYTCKSALAQVRRL